MNKAIEKHIGRRSLLKAGAALTFLATTLPALPASADTNDSALIEAEAEITRLHVLPIHKDENIDCCDEPRQSIYDEIYRLEDFSAETPASLAGVAVKLRRLLDRGIDLYTDGRVLPALLSALALVHGAIGKPAHPTRPLYTLEEDGWEPEPTAGGAA